MPSLFNADTKELDKFITTLSEMHRSALPNVVRNTLNDLAFNAKKTELTKVTNDKFTVRSKNFFKANSRFTKATGYNVNTMHSDMGMVAKDVATRNLKQQEEGGQIGKRAFIQMDTARVGKSHTKKVAGKNRLSKIRLVNAAKATGSKKTKFMRSVVYANKTNAHLLHKGIVFAIKNLRRKGRNMKFRLLPLYSYKKGRSANLKAAHFMKETGKVTQSTHTLSVFQNNYKKQIAKLKSKGRL